jgi:hypothetical protein
LAAQKPIQFYTTISLSTSLSDDPFLAKYPMYISHSYAQLQAVHAITQKNRSTQTDTSFTADTNTFEIDSIHALQDAGFLETGDV